jgi:hypothetical protein
MVTITPGVCEAGLLPWSRLADCRRTSHGLLSLSAWVHYGGGGEGSRKQDRAYLASTIGEARR